MRKYRDGGKACAAKLVVKKVKRDCPANSLAKRRLERRGTRQKHTQTTLNAKLKRVRHF